MVPSRFMPTFLNDCVNLYRFKIEQINNCHLPESYCYTTAVELKNELWSWLEMYFLKYRKKLALDGIKLEIQRCCDLPEIIEAVNYPKEDTSGIAGFRNLVKEKNVDEILKLVIRSEKKSRPKRFIKKYILKL